MLDWIQQEGIGVHLPEERHLRTRSEDLAVEQGTKQDSLCNSMEGAHYIHCKLVDHHMQAGVAVTLKLRAKTRSRDEP